MEFDINNIKAIKKTKPAINQGMLGGSSYFGQEHLLKEAYNFSAAQSCWTAVASGSRRAFCSQYRSRSLQGCCPIGMIFRTDLGFEWSMIPTWALMGHTPVKSVWHLGEDFILLIVKVILYYITLV